MALNLITKAEYKAYTGIKSTNEDAVIDALIPRVSELVKHYCRRSFVDYMDETAKVDTFSGGTTSFILAETPVVEIVSVEQSTDYGQTYTALTEFTDWVLSKDTLLPTYASKVFPELINGYKVTYKAGYHDVPQDVALAVMDLVTYYRRNDASIHNNRLPGSGGGGGSIQLEYITNTSLPAHIRRVLDLYVADYT